MPVGVALETSLGTIGTSKLQECTTPSKHLFTAQSRCIMDLCEWAVRGNTQVWYAAIVKSKAQTCSRIGSDVYVSLQFATIMPIFPSSICAVAIWRGGLKSTFNSCKAHGINAQSLASWSLEARSGKDWLNFHWKSAALRSWKPYNGLCYKKTFDVRKLITKSYLHYC